MTRAAARCVSRMPRVHHAPGEQPGVGRAADRDVPVPRANGPRGGAARGASARAAAAAPSPSDPRAAASSSQCRGSTTAYRATPRTAAPSRTWRPAARPGSCSMRRPNGTPDGHAASQPAARHALLHRGAERVVDRRVVPLDARIAAMRPRGDAISRPVTRYVGQCGRHSPHDTHATSASSSRWSGPLIVSRGRRPVRPNGRRPGLQPAVGVERVLDPAHQRGVRQRPAVAVVVGRAARFAEHPAAVRVRDARAPARARRRRRPRRARCRRRAPHTSARRPAASDRRSRTRSGRTEMRPRCDALGQRRRPRSSARVASLRLRRRLRRPRAARARVRAVPEARRRPVERAAGVDTRTSARHAGAGGSAASPA